MNAKLKIAAYAVVVILLAWFAWGFHSNYAIVQRESAETNSTAAQPATNAATDTNALASTNAAAATNSSTNIDTNAPAPVPATAPAAAAPVTHHERGRMMAYLAALVGAFIALGLLVAHDVTQYLGNVAVDTLLDVSDEATHDPEYEKAEQAWANGRHLEAIQMMRDFLKSHPREQYAALRIAEIYEKDLNNPLAAALEYEEVLKKKLPSERWGWAAIHLCNLYSKLGQQDKTRALLERIADEYPKTGAAKKARARLGLPEPEPEPEAKHTAPAGEPSSNPVISPPPAEEPEPAPAPEPKSNLPPGFRPKK